MDPKEWLIVIPARLKSERLPNKPLLDLGGKPLIVRVVENLQPLKDIGVQIVVAVDHEETHKVCREHGIDSIMTSLSHKSGTDRCAEVARKFGARKFVLNVQGDEPFISCDDLINLAKLMSSQKPPMATLACSSTNNEDYRNPNVVKVVVSDKDEALYFSRAPIPFDRDGMQVANPEIRHLQHQGIYAFTQESLMKFCQLPQSTLEQVEKLEQLRALAAGWKILVTKSSFKSLSIDTPDDLMRAKAVLDG
jgi:3-deoxy-manno-octulosonate cytidylyltransferase (CMP-KDO synthetase)